MPEELVTVAVYFSYQLSRWGPVEYTQECAVCGKAIEKDSWSAWGKMIAHLWNVHHISPVQCGYTEIYAERSIYERRIH